MQKLAEKTGGAAVQGTNDLSGGIRRLFHRLSLKVTRPGGYRVRMRDGFFGVPDEKPGASESTPREQIAAALLSPFGASGVRVQLTSLFANDAKAGSFTRSILYVDANDLTFKEEADGWHTATFDLPPGLTSAGKPSPFPSQEWPRRQISCNFFPAELFSRRKKNYGEHRRRVRSSFQ